MIDKTVKVEFPSYFLITVSDLA